MKLKFVTRNRTAVIVAQTERGCPQPQRVECRPAQECDQPGAATGPADTVALPANKERRVHPTVPFFRISDFGFLSDLEFRTSNFRFQISNCLSLRGLSLPAGPLALACWLLLLSLTASAQEPETNAPPSTISTNTTNTTSNTNANAGVSAPANPWSFSISAYGYIVPDSRDYVQPTVTADHGWLHLEGRYNYEALDTGSAWVGYNVSGGSNFTWQVTSMVGGVFGDLNGIAPGYTANLGWWKLQLYSSGEYVFDVGDSSQSFFYNWSELSISPVSWFRVGMVTQRTRAYQTDRDIQRGVLAGFTYKNASVTGYVFNPDESKPLVVIGATLTF
jgi:hypothetical protein